MRLCAVLLFCLVAGIESQARFQIAFFEDFGGNEVSDPPYRESGIPEVIDYRYKLWRPNESSSGFYSIRKSRYHGSWHYMDDHTIEGDKSRGYLMYVDTWTDENKELFYRKEVDVGCTRVLTFGIWVVNVNTYHQSKDRWSKPNLEFRISDFTTGNVLLSELTGEIPLDRLHDEDTSSVVWNHRTATITIPAGVNKIVFEMYSKSHDYMGGDFAVDDIEIGINVPDEFALPDLTVCDGEEVRIEAPNMDYTEMGDDAEWRWEKLSDDGVTWEMAGSGRVFAPGKAEASMSGRYRLSVARRGYIDNDYCAWRSNLMTLTVRERVVNDLSAEICDGESYEFDGKQLTSPGVYTQITTDPTTGCNVYTNLSLEMKLPTKRREEGFICRGDSYDFGGKALTENGVYVRNGISPETGCNEETTLELRVIEKEVYNETATICDGEIYRFDGKDLTAGGVYTSVTKSEITGCDIETMLELTVAGKKETHKSAEIGHGETYDWGGMTLTEPGEYTVNDVTTDGCDSVATLRLRVRPQAVAVAEDDLTIPEGFSPNDDGVNDRFAVEGLENYPDNRIRIFNRWGNKVFECAPYRNDWDGRNHEGGNVGSDRLPAGTYYYLLWKEDGRGKPRKGWVYLSY